MQDVRRLKVPRSAAGISELSSRSTLTASRCWAGGQGLGQGQALAHPQHMGVDGQAGQVEVDAAHHVARLAAHPREWSPDPRASRDLAVEALDHRGGHADEALVFDRKNPVRRMISSTSSGLAAASDSGSGYLAKSAGVTMFTRASVLWADRMVAAKIVFDGSGAARLIIASLASTTPDIAGTAADLKRLADQARPPNLLARVLQLL